ncbi:RHS repeat-associated core domain-containing protein [Methylomonas sp. AM2-LC]|uniref:RHS repeat-associated core domain-containing protein n=1 Tax=Methylomonas sp. AM2-LC TaxID=3153301 RepID=UPI00326435A9
MEQLHFLKKLNLSLWVSACVFLLGNEVVQAGGYVNGNQTLNPANTGSVTVTPTFNNAQFTNKVLVSTVNNNPIKTPSTADPVSTITGNNYHDELDFQIRGRNGLNYVFSRTNNSAQVAATADIGMGYGWVHSYSMNLVSNDFGSCPNCTKAQAPQNFDSITSSITYTDERGGQVNFLETPTTTNGVTTYSIGNALGDFDTLTIASPVTTNGVQNQLLTLAFRNGTQYLFKVTGGDIGLTPNLTAKLTTIKNQWGDQLNINYDSSGRISTITDNLGISTRTGLTFNYANGDNHISSINDWAGRTWKYSYTSGYLSTYTDPLNNVLSYYYTAGKYYNNFQTGVGNYLLQSVVKPQTRNGLSVYTIFNFYQNGRVINYWDGMQDTEIMDYDLYRQRTRVTDPRGFVRQYDYDGNGFQTEMREPDGGILNFTSQADNLRATKTDALGYKTQYSYCLNQSLTACATSSGGSDTGGNVTLEQDALGYTIKTTYGPYDQVASVTDKNGNTTNTSFYTTTGQQTNKCDLAGKPNTVSIAVLGTATNVALQTYCWNSNGTLNNLKEYLDTASAHIRTTGYTYDSTGLNVTDVNVTATNTTAVIHTQFTYDNLGRMLTNTLNRTTSITNSALEQLTTTHTYDALDREIKVQNPEGRIDQTIYDGNGEIYQQITWYPSTTARPNCAAPATPTGYTISYVQCTEATYSYDAADRPISVTDIFGKTISMVYDQSGNMISFTDANGHTSQFQYDAMNRVTVAIDANGRTSKSVYNERGDLVSATNPNNETVTKVYDALGRLTKVMDNIGNVTTFSYDKNGNTICVVDANGNSVSTALGHQPVNSLGCTVSYTYDQLNRNTQVTDAQNHGTAFTYNLLGQTLTITDANSHSTTLAYDDLGRLTTAIDPMTNSVGVVTDEAGNAIQMTNRKGQISQHFYDVMNRKTQSSYTADGSSDTFTYNSFDDLTNVQNNSTGNTFSYSFNYDSKHRLISKTDSRLGLSESWTYDPVGNIYTKTDYQGNVTTYQYDDSNRLTAETNPVYLEVSYHYDPAGRILDRILSNGAKTSYKYDAGGRLSSLVNSTITNALVNSTTYTRDAIGNILTAIEASGTSQVAGSSTFTYDPEYRLLTAAYPTTTNNETITYDPVGNRTKYIKGSTTLFYNVNAANRYTTTNTTSATGPVYETYTYDKNGSLTNITGNRTLTLTWDAHNRASQIQVGAILPYSYQYDINSYRILKNLGATTSINNYYLENGKLESIYDNSGNVQAKYMRGSVIDEVVNGYQTNSGAMTNYTYHHDALESVLGQSGNTGTVAAAQGYTAFGSIVNATGNSNNTLKYSGRDLDSETGLYYYRARYYDPLTGRFLSEDPIRSGINFYTYCGNNPVNCNDPFGLTQNDIDVARQLAIQTQPDLKFPASYGSQDLPGKQVGWTMFESDKPDAVAWATVLDIRYQQPLSDEDAAKLLDTIIHEAIHFTYQLGDSRQPDDNGKGYPYTEANHRTTKSLIRLYNQMRKQNGGNTSNPAKPSSSNNNSSVPDAGLIAATNSAMDSINSMLQPNIPAAPVRVGIVEVLPLEEASNDGGGAYGGFVIYPNMSNTSQIKSVYSKH